MEHANCQFTYAAYTHRERDSEREGKSERDRDKTDLSASAMCIYRAVVDMIVMHINDDKG